MRGALIFVFSAILLVYTLGPFLWLVSSSFQTESEIVSIPPHWIPHEPTLDNYRAIFGASESESKRCRSSRAARRGRAATQGSAWSNESCSSCCWTNWASRTA